MTRFSPRHSWTVLVLAGCFVAGSAFAADEPHAHVHGLAEMTVAVDANQLSITLDSPLDSLLGFEHAPGNDAQKQAVRQLSQRFSQPLALFVTPAAAGCAVSSSSVSAPVIGMALGDAKAASASTPKADAHAGHADHDDGGTQHGDLDAAFVFTCRTTASLTGLAVQLFDGFPGMRQINVQVAGPKGQSAVRLTPQQRNVSW
jgi:hypothetical protein